MEAVVAVKTGISFLAKEWVTLKKENLTMNQKYYYLSRNLKNNID